MDAYSRRALIVDDDRITPETVVMLSGRLMALRDLPELSTTIVSLVQELLHADQVLLISKDHGQLRIAARATDAPIDERVWQAAAAWTIANRQPLVLSPYGARPNGFYNFPQSRGRALACVPLIAHTQHVLGALLLEQRNLGGFRPSQVELVQLLASLSASALENARAYAQAVQNGIRAHTLLEHARDAVLLLNCDGTAVLDANRAASALTGHSRDELLSLTPRALFQTFKLGELDSQAEVETKLLARDGREVPVSVGVSKVLHGNEEYVLLIVRDISERGRLAQQLIQTEKLTGMSRLTASIAHEVNNPLQALQSSLNLLVERSMSDEKRAQILQMAREQVEQLVGLVQHMMDLYRPARDDMRPVSPHELLEAVLTLLGSRLEQCGITVERDWEQYLPRVRGVSSQLKQVFGSLVLNAIDAMPEGGVLTIRTRLVDLASGKQVLIEVADTGNGITPHQMRNIFEPFYTTRSQRTGLSLAVSYSIIEQHEGTLTVVSDDSGATFVVGLPALT